MFCICSSIICKCLVCVLFVESLRTKVVMILQCICGHRVRLMLQFYLRINGVMCMLKQFSEAIYKLNQ